jgi:hypothetical protein
MEEARINLQAGGDWTRTAQSAVNTQLIAEAEVVRKILDWTSTAGDSTSRKHCFRGRNVPSGKNDANAVGAELQAASRAIAQL